MIVAELRGLSNAKSPLLTASEMVYLFKNIGCPLSSLEEKAIKDDFQLRGGFTFADVEFLASQVYTDQAMQTSIREALLQITDSKPRIKAAQLLHYLLRTGSLIRLTLAEITDFIRGMYARENSPAPLTLNYEFSIDKIVDALVKGL